MSIGNIEFNVHFTFAAGQTAASFSFFDASELPTCAEDSPARLLCLQELALANQKNLPFPQNRLRSIFQIATT